MKCSEIRDHFAKWSAEEIWSALWKQNQALQPFWLLATKTWASHLKTPADKLAQHTAAIDNAFEWMDGWRSGRTKLVKKNENAVESAISYLRNNALNRKVSGLLMAPVARNVASCLRSCLHVATFNYDDEELPSIIACEIYELAAVRNLFHFDTENFVQFAPDSIHGVGADGVEADIDNYNAMLEIGCQRLGLENELQALKAEAERLCKEFKDPQPMDMPARLETLPGGQFNTQLAALALRDFHGK